MPLTMATTGEERTILKIGGKPDVKMFLATLGFVVGSSIAVVSELNGSVIVNIKDSRIAISREMANKIQV